jgi:hypothetical protein
MTFSYSTMVKCRKNNTSKNSLVRSRIGRFPSITFVNCMLTEYKPMANTSSYTHSKHNNYERNDQERTENMSRTTTMHKPHNQKLQQQRYRDVDQHDHLRQPLHLNHSQLQYHLEDRHSNDRDSRLHQNRVMQLRYHENQQYSLEYHQRQDPHQLQQQNNDQQRQKQRNEKRRERHVSFDLSSTSR